MSLLITAERLRALLDYSPKEGTFRWLAKKGNRATPGKLAGSISVYGYRIIRIDQRDYRAARLAWLYTHGVWPAALVDHINCVRSDDRIENLREATYAQNNANSKPRSRRKTAAPKGVSYHKAGRCWTAHIAANGVSEHLGSFQSIDMAAAAYAAAAERLHGNFTRLA